MENQIGPDIIHPEVESAVGSRNSLAREGRNEDEESRLLASEEVDKILNHISSKLPPEVLSKVDIMNGVKEKLHNYYNISYQNMYNRYITTVEDELAKKYRSLVASEEGKGLHKYSPRLISDILTNIGGFTKFNTGEIEKSVVNIFGHLQGAIQRETYNLETETNAILRQKMDIGAFVRGENTYSIAKCSIKDNQEKPSTVSDLKMAINILDSELISPVLHLHGSAALLLRTIASEEITAYLEDKITKINANLLNSGKAELVENEAIIKKISLLDEYIGQDESGEVKFELVAKHILEAVEEVPNAIKKIDALSLRDNILLILENEGIRDRGYNTAINILTSVLDSSKMGYQHIENQKNTRMCRIKEYADNNINALPDERYNVLLNYYDFQQIQSMRRSYEKQFTEFQKGFNEALSLIEKNYSEYRKKNNVIDYSDVLDDMRPKEVTAEESFLKKFLKEKSQTTTTTVVNKNEIVDDKDNDTTWSEFRFIGPDEKNKVKQHRKFDLEIRELKEKLNHIKSRLVQIYTRNFPEDRVLIEERIETLNDRFNTFASKVNPFQLQPGICLEINITSVKRKKTTIMSMANVLNEFLHNISRGFSDAAFASFQRRRSTVKDGMEDPFSSFDSNLKA